MGKPSGQPTQTTTAINPQSDELIGLGLPFARQFAASPPTLPNTPLVAGFDPLQTQGQESVLGATGAQQTLANTGADLAQFLSGDVLYPQTNPALGATIEAATRPITTNLLEQALPAVRSGAAAAGQFGSSRQGIAEGQAIRGAQQAIGDTSAKIATAGYQSGLDALLKNLSLLPQTTALQTTPGITTSGVGDVRQQQTQAELGEAATRQQFEQLLPLIMAQNLIGLGSSIPTQSTANTPTASPLTQGIGLAASVLPALLSFSDRRLKESIRQIGTIRGVPVFRFRYRGEVEEQVGFMSDQVPPEAVRSVMGFDVVDYSEVLRRAA
jgi:hypothetical protein